MPNARAAQAVRAAADAGRAGLPREHAYSQADFVRIEDIVTVAVGGGARFGQRAPGTGRRLIGRAGGPVIVTVTWMTW
ncbi:hypothetical protein [Streptomyces sp. NBC_00239]|uniref:hypothetical protein n=1 Tax=Streptomyces sp. NBC_00239 TaxID=2903640 RepID=UPI002E2E4381|nr:hypothetical protein [Streptomyces sp. NBC_00239]